MSITTLNGIKALVQPFVTELEIHPSDNGLCLRGLTREGYHREFLSLADALRFANEQRMAVLEGRQ